MPNTILIYTLLAGCILVTGVITCHISQQYIRLKYRKDLEQATAIIREKEQTLRMVANELHDNIGQLLFIQHMAIKETYTRHPHPLLANALRTNTTIQNEIKNLCRAFHTDHIAQEGFEAMLQNIIRKIDDQPNIKAIFSAHGTYARQLSQEQELMLIRIIQEVLHNCLKHTNADTLTITVDYLTHHIRICILDNHTEKKATGDTKGLGQRSIAARAQLLHATYSYDFEKHTRFNISVPVKAQKQPLKCVQHINDINLFSNTCKR